MTMPCYKGTTWKRERFAEFWKLKKAHKKLSDEQIWTMVKNHFNITRKR